MKRTILGLVLAVSLSASLPQSVLADTSINGITCVNEGESSIAIGGVIWKYQAHHWSALGRPNGLEGKEFQKGYNVAVEDYVTASSFPAIKTWVENAAVWCMKQGTTDFDHASAIATYLCNNLTYQETGINHIFGESGVTTGKTVCEGYSSLYTLIANEMGFVAGEVESDAMWHKWNYIVVDNVVYFSDSTWQDTSGVNYNMLSFEDMNKDHWVTRTKWMLNWDEDNKMYIDSYFKDIVVIEELFYMSESMYNRQVEKCNLYKHEKYIYEKLLRGESVTRNEYANQECSTHYIDHGDY